VNGPFPFAAQDPGTVRLCLIAIGVGEIAERAVNRTQTVRTGGNDHAADGIVPHVAPMIFTGIVAVLIRQNAVICVRTADHGRACFRGGRVVGDTEMQAFIALRRFGDFVDIGHAERRFDDVFETDFLLALHGILDLGHQHIDGIDVGGGPNLRDHDHVQTLATLLQDVDDVAVHVMRIQAVDAHRHGLIAPVDVVQGFDDVLAGLLLLVRRNGVFAIQEDHVDIRRSRFFEKFRAAARHGQFASVQARCGLFNNGKAHGWVPFGFGVSKSAMWKIFRITENSSFS